LIYDMIFIYCSRVFTRWQWFVSLYTNKEAITYIMRNKIQNNTETQNTQNTKQNIQNKKTCIKQIIKT
jgi:hypothetical protein